MLTFTDMESLPADIRRNLDVLLDYARDPGNNLSVHLCELLERDYRLESRKTTEMRDLTRSSGAKTRVSRPMELSDWARRHKLLLERLGPRSQADLV